MTKINYNLPPSPTANIELKKYFFKTIYCEGENVGFCWDGIVIEVYKITPCYVYVKLFYYFDNQNITKIENGGNALEEIPLLKNGRCKINLWYDKKCITPHLEGGNDLIEGQYEGGEVITYIKRKYGDGIDGLGLNQHVKSCFDFKKATTY